ncbi:Uncharacterised protein [Chlamydia abortus]|nr:Uncharacterised protein [Chlamydia abortus]
MNRLTNGSVKLRRGGKRIPFMLTEAGEVYSFGIIQERSGQLQEGDRIRIQ